MTIPCYLGVDVGSVSTNVVIGDISDGVIKNIYAKVYVRTKGDPINAIKEGLIDAQSQLRTMGQEIKIVGCGTTGSGRNLAGAMIGADAVKNEISTHAAAAVHEVPDVNTIMEIGGQDSKIIIVQNGIAVDFAMNTVCAAGTGSFLDHQATRLEIPIEEFGTYATRAEKATPIAGRCGVFAESDMIHKQQIGHTKEEIILGLCMALARNYLNMAKGKEIKSPIVFQGGVAANQGMKRAFEEALNAEITIPTHFNVMGALGASLFAYQVMRTKNETGFRGFLLTNEDYKTSAFHCKGCSNQCEIMRIQNEQGETLENWGGQCGKWDRPE